MSAKKGPRPSDYLALGFVSGGALAYEILLLRVFSFSQWHHFASLAVSLALLGFGTAGTLLTLLGKRAVRMGDRLFMSGLLLTSGGMLLASQLPRFISVRPLFAVWDSSELGKLLLLDFAAFLPFFGAALCVGQVFMRWPESTRRLYGVNLLGSGLGAMAAALLLSCLLLESALLTVPAAVLLGGTVLGLRHREMRPWGVACLAAAVAISSWIARGPAPLPMSDFKRLATLLDLPDSKVLERRPGLQGQIAIVRSDSIRSAPGLSLTWTRPVPPQDALVLDSDRWLPLPRQEWFPDPFAATLASLPFHLRKGGRTALIGASEWLTPAMPGEQELIWVHRNPGVVEAFAGRGLLENVLVRSMDPRGFLERSIQPLDLVYFADSYNEGEATGEEYLLTVGGIRSALESLKPSGLLAIPLRLHNPPRYAPKLMRVIAASLQETGAEEALRHFALLRSLQEGLFIVSPEPLSAEDVQRIREFAGRLEFDLSALPGLSLSETNRYHLLDEPLFFEAALALQGGQWRFPEEATWYSLEPPTDDRPYFWRSMRWGNLPRLLREFGRQGLVWLDWTLLATVTKLLVAGLLAGILILLPLGRLPRGRPPITRQRVWIYFTALGLGFLVLEMAAFQRSILTLSDPITTASLVFSVFLVGAGLGSLTAPGLRDRAAPAAIFLPILVTALLSFLLLKFAMETVAGMPAWMRLATVGASIAPLSWALGQAFPWGLRQLDEDRELIPWAWGINGFASVLAAPLATLLSVHAGQTATWLAGALCYLAAWFVARSWAKQWSWYG
ncbi:MAG: hypothetical protein ACP5I4_16420 [Oceanipulchritudo sp.]